MKALHFGAGNIGRGFIGKLLADAGVEVIFADVNSQIVELLASRKEYQVHVVGEQERIETVKPVTAVNSTQPEVYQLIAKTDLITTAVGPQVLEKIAPTIAKGLVLRHQQANNQPLNIIACENMVRGTSAFKKYILHAVPVELHNWVEQHVGFVDSAVDRIVPPAVSASGDLLEVTVETFSEWIVDGTQFKGSIPNIAGMETTDNLMAYVERKLFTLNTGHAITAYLGQQEGLQTIRDAILDPAIANVVKGAMQESGSVLIKRYGFDPIKHAAYIDKIITRFENPYLHDDVDRVGRQPLRKLSAGDRLVKPLIGTLEYHLPHDNLIVGIIAALRYRNSDDPQAQELAERLATQPTQTVISEVTGLAIDNPVTLQIANSYNNIS